MGINNIIMEKQNITITTKCQIVKALVLPQVECGREYWTIRKTETRRDERVELWYLVRLLKYLIFCIARTMSKSLKH